MILQKIKTLMVRVAAFLYKHVKALSISRKTPKNTYYPLDETGRLWCSRLMFPIGDWGYCAQFYKQRWYARPELLLEEQDLPVEVLYAKMFRDYALINIDSACVMPVAIKNRKGFSRRNTKEINIFVNDTMETIRDAVEERYYYLKIPSKSTVKVESHGSDLFVAKPLSLQRRTSGLKLILPIFIDGLSYEFFRFGGISEVMPNTNRFFSKGTVFQNCHTTSEWSLTSLATIFTGLTTQHHGIFHSVKPQPLHTDHMILSEYFQQQGFLTTQICGNWRKNPSIGYARGFDRTIYKREMECTEVIAEFLDFMHGFKDRDIMTWLTFFDIHRPWCYRIPSIAIQPHMNIELHGSNRLMTKSVDAAYDDLAIRAYLHELKRLDYYLDILYDFIRKEYSDDEILVVLLSDHGQSYLDDEDHALADARIRVPLMFRGRNVRQMVSNEYVQNTDILPSVLHLAGLQMPNMKIDGLLPKCLGGLSEREYVFAESVFREQTYKCIYKDKFSKYIFESEIPVDNDGRVDAKNVHLVTVRGRGGRADYYERILQQYLERNA